MKVSYCAFRVDYNATIFETQRTAVVSAPNISEVHSLLEVELERNPIVDDAARAPLRVSKIEKIDYKCDRPGVLSL